MRRVAVLLCLFLILQEVPSFSAAVPKPGTRCSSLGQKKVFANKSYICLKRSGKLVWSKGVVTKPLSTPALTPTPTVSPTLSGLTASDPHQAEVGINRGAWFRVGNDELLFGATISGERAWRLVAPDRLMKRPQAGWSIVLGTVKFRASTKDLSRLWPNITIDYVGSDGKAYRNDELSKGGYCSYSLDLSPRTGRPDYDFYPWAESGEFPQFYVCTVVPDQAIQGGVWKISSGDIFFQPRVQYAEAKDASDLKFPKGLTPVNPYAAQVDNHPGDWFEIPFFAGNYGFLFGKTVTGAAAWEILNGPYNSVKPPRQGWSAVLVVARLENRSEQSAAPFLNLIDPVFIGNDGVRYVGYDSLSPGGSCPWIPSALFQRSLDKRQTFTFTACAVVPDAVIQGGVWQIGPYNPFIIPQHLYIEAKG